MLPIVNEDIEIYVQELTGACGGIESIWLIGSRANDAEQQDSDWDIIIFATDAALQCIRLYN